MLTLLIAVYAAFRLGGLAAATTAAALLAVTGQFYAVSREALTDTAFIFGVTLAIIAFAALQIERRSRPSAFLWTQFAAGLLIASLSKGLAAYVVVAYAFAYAWVRERRLAPTLSIVTFVASLPFVGWIGLEAWQDPSFLRDYLGQEYFQRFNYRSTFLPSHIQPPSWYLRHLWEWYGLMPLLVATGGLFFVARRNDFPAQAFIGGFILFLFVVLSLASHKDQRYLAPLLPFCALVSGLFVGQIASRSRPIARSVVGSVFVLVVGISSIDLYRHYDPKLDHFPGTKAVAQQLAQQLRAEDLVVVDNFLSTHLIHFYTRHEISNNVFLIYQSKHKGRIFIVQTDEEDFDKAKIMLRSDSDLATCGPDGLRINTDSKTYEPNDPVTISIRATGRKLRQTNLYLAITDEHLAYPFRASGELHWRYVPVAVLDDSMRLRFVTKADPRLKAGRYKVCVLATQGGLFPTSGSCRAACTAVEIKETTWAR
jgi:hypothetical protein